MSKVLNKPTHYSCTELNCQNSIYKNMWFQTYFSQYQTALDKVRCLISFKSNIHNMNGIFLAIGFTA